MEEALDGELVSRIEGHEKTLDCGWAIDVGFFREDFIQQVTASGGSEGFGDGFKLFADPFLDVVKIECEEAEIGDGVIHRGGLHAIFWLLVLIVFPLEALIFMSLEDEVAKVVIADGETSGDLGNDGILRDLIGDESC